MIRLLLVALLTASAASSYAGNWNVPTKARAVISPVAASKENARRGAVIYRDHCVECHGTHGAGDGTKEKVSYDLKSILDPLADGELYWKITHGVGKMPSVAGILTEEERWLVIQHLRTIANRAPAASAR